LDRRRCGAATARDRIERPRDRPRELRVDGTRRWRRWAQGPAVARITRPSRGIGADLSLPIEPIELCHQPEEHRDVVLGVNSAIECSADCRAHGRPRAGRGPDATATDSGIAPESCTGRRPTEASRRPVAGPDLTGPAGTCGHDHAQRIGPVKPVCRMPSGPIVPARMGGMRLAHRQASDQRCRRAHHARELVDAMRARRPRRVA